MRAGLTIPRRVLCVLGKHLQTEHGNPEREQEGVQQGVHLAQDTDVVDEHAVPQEPKHKRQDHNVEKEDGQLGEQFSCVAGGENADHFILCVEINASGASSTDIGASSRSRTTQANSDCVSIDRL